MTTLKDLSKGLGNPFKSTEKGTSYVLTQTLNEGTYTFALSEEIGVTQIGLWLGDEYIGFFCDGTITFHLASNLNTNDLIIKSLSEGGEAKRVKLEKGENPNPTWTPAWEDLPIEDKPVSFIETIGGGDRLKYRLNVVSSPTEGVEYQFGGKIKNIGGSSMVMDSNSNASVEVDVNETIDIDFVAISRGVFYDVRYSFMTQNTSDNLSFYAYNPSVHEAEERQEVDFTEIPPNERKELVFQNNPILDKDREYWASKIFPLIGNTHYKTFSANTLSGYGIFEIGDIVEVEEYNTGLTHTTIITDEHTTHRHMLVSEVKSDKPFDSKERYVVVTDERREGQQTYILVDQLNGEIIAAVESIDELDGVVTEQGSSLSLLNDQVNVEISQRITNAEGTLETINESISTVESTQQTFTDRITNLEGEMVEQQTFFRTGMDGLTIGGTDWETVMHADGEKISFQSQTGNVEAQFGANGMYTNRWELDFHTIEKFEEGTVKGTIFKNRRSDS